MIKFLFTIGVKIRGFLNFYRKPKDTSVFNCTVEEFSNKLSTKNYRYDPLKGAIDYTASPDSFFKTKKWGRDCDDWARMWLTYGKLNGYKGYEIVVANKTCVFKHAHVVTVLVKDDKYILCNYKPYYGFTSVEEAVTSLESNSHFDKNLIWAISKKETLGSAQEASK